MDRKEMPDQSGETDKDKYIDLVFAGGGITGIAMVGALDVLIEEGFQPQNLAGCSMGAMVATLYAAGYTPAEMKSIIASTEISSFTDEAWEDNIPLIGKPFSIVKDLGIYEGEALLAWMRELLLKKDVRTFRQLINPRHAAGERYRYKVRLVATDITSRQLLTLPQDAVKLGVEPDDLDVALAVRMSISIPFFFEPVKFRHPGTGEVHVIVDGGLLSCFPIWLFTPENGEPKRPTFGIHIARRKARDRSSPSSHQPDARSGGVWEMLEFLKSLGMTLLEAHDRIAIEEAYFARLITIPHPGINTTDFGLNQEQAAELYEAGRAAAKDFLQGWSLETYRAEIRRSMRQLERGEMVREFGRLALSE